MRAGLLVALLCFAGLVEAQELRLDDYLRQVRSRHPVARQAQLSVDAADAELRGARGAFEPSLSAAWDSKTFGGKSYYDELGVKLSVPTAYGVDLKFGYDRATGANLNPESALPKNGLWSAGVSIPIGQRMLTDERRTAVDLARAGRESADGERTALLNKLTLTAAKDWAAWYETERRAAIGREGVALAEFRLSAVRSRVRNGDAAGIDTVEALLEVERRSVTRLEADAAAYSARLAAGAHLWDDAGRPTDARRPRGRRSQSRTRRRSSDGSPSRTNRIPTW
jgi:outer membrane protein TolC